MSVHLNLFIRAAGFHSGAWRLPGSRPAEAVDAQWVIDLAKQAEKGLFDSVFLADGPVISSNPWLYTAVPFEPLTLLSAVAMATSNIGLIATASTTYSEPYNIARQFAALDHISHGRAGWNIVTTQSLVASQNFGGLQLSHADRYERAAEYLAVVRKLWDSWEDDALVGDKESGLNVDPAKVHEINHVGKYFRIRGPLNIPRPPQGHPVLVQAGSSPQGMEFGAGIADAIFTAQHTLEGGQAFYRAVKDLGGRHGRCPDEIKVFPGLAPLLGSTEAEAQELAAELEALALPEHSLARLSAVLEVDLSQYPYDGPVPVADMPPADQLQGAKSRAALIADMCVNKNMTIRDLVRWHISGDMHRTFVGTPEQLADDIETWVRAGAADGFNLMPSVNESGLALFVEHVLPELQRRGLYRREYESATLRGNLGLPRVARPA